MAALLLAAAAVSAAAASATVTISNVLPRRDTTGAIVDMHDGSIIISDSHPGVYFWYAAGYGLCPETNSTTGCSNGFTGCGFFTNHSVNLYTSSDLVTWTPHGNVLPEANRVDAILFSPKVVYNARTNLYILWYNYVPSYSYGVATAPTPFGPFATVNASAGASFQYGYPTNKNVGDFSIMLDDDGEAYFLYSANAHCQVERLAPDFLSSSWIATGETSGILPHGNEAPAFFKRAGVYYALVSDSCCYCEQGGLVHSFAAASPLGPYVYLGEIAAGPHPGGAPDGRVATEAQQTAVFAVPQAGGESQVIWVGDRWQSAPDRLKGHDFTFWAPLSFLANGSIARLTWLDSFELAMPAETPAARARRFPPRGFNPCNGFGCTMDKIGEAGLRQLADALVESGAVLMNYTWFNLDDGFIASRAADGSLQCSQPAFPSGTLAPLAAYVGARGMSLGAYTDRGTATCEGRPGAAGYEAQDAATFASWGVRWLKEDSCSAPSSFAAAHAQYGAMAAGLRASGVDVFFSLCGWWQGYASFSALAPHVGDAWRVATDVGSWERWLVNVEAAATTARFAGPLRGWPDIDMLSGVWSAAQERLRLCLIAVIGAPLLLSWNVSDATHPTLGLARYLDGELLAVHGDDAAPAVAARGAYYARVAGGAVSGAASATAAPFLPVDTAGDCAAAEAAWAWTPDAATPGYGSLQPLSQPGLCLGLWDNWPSTQCLLPLAAQLVPCNNSYGCSAASMRWAIDAANASVATALDWAGKTPRPGPFLSAVGGVPSALYVQEAAGGGGGGGPALAQSWTSNLSDTAAPGVTTLRSPAGACLAAPAVVSSTNVWARFLANGDVALLLFNAGARAARVICDAACFAQLGDAAAWRARDVWAHADAGTLISAEGFTTAPLDAVGGSLLLRLAPV